MGSGRKFRKKPMTRPIKSAAARAQRMRQQKARLIALGADAKVVQELDAKATRAMLKHPAKIQAS